MLYIEDIGKWCYDPTAGTFVEDGERNATFLAGEIAAMAAADYERQCGLARALAEEYFDAQKVVGRVLERVLA